MPSVNIPVDRTFVNKETVTIDETDVELYTYAEEYRHSWSVIRGLLGLNRFYYRRHMKSRKQSLSSE